MRTLWAILVAICLIATGASRALHDDGPRRDSKHAALRVVAASAPVAAPGRAHGHLDHGLLATTVAAPELPAPPRAVLADTSIAARSTPGLVDAIAHRSRAPPLDLDLS